MSEIRIKDHESLDSALRRFKRSCAKDGVLSEIRKREHYEKPSVKRNRKRQEKESLNNLNNKKATAKAVAFLCVYALF